MTPDGAVPASLIIVTFNSADHIASLLDAVTSDPSPPREVIVVDNASEDGTRDIVSGFRVRLIELEENLGFGAGCHAGADAAAEDALVFINPDAVPVRGWVPPLLDALEEPGVGAVTATLELSDRPGHFNTSGGAVAFSGLAWVTDLGEPIPADEEIGEVPFPSGAAMAVTKAVWDRLGGFRRDLFMYHEDTDVGWRLKMHGLKTVRTPHSRVAHSYSFAGHPQKMLWLERNRWLLLLTNYRRSTLALLAPALLAVEAGIVAVAIRDGWLSSKIKSWAEVAARLSGTGGSYRAVQRDRRIGDASILETMDARVGSIAVPEVPIPSGARTLDGLLAGYVRLVLPLIRWLDRRHGLG